MKSAYLSLLLLGASATLSHGKKLTSMGCEYDNRGQSFKLTRNVPYSPKYSAWGTFNDSLDSTGWGQLHIRSQSTDAADNYGAVYCAGVIEGELTHTRISQHFKIWRRTTLEDFNLPEDADWPENLKTWMKTNIKYTRSGIDTYQQTDPWWRATGYAVTRVDGMIEGYNRAKTTLEMEMNELDFWLLQSYGDMDDIGIFLNTDKITGQIFQHSNEWYDTHHHCTALIRLEDSYQDVFIAQDAWTNLNQMNRILKDYELNIIDPSIASTRWTFSSNPGITLSIDDLWLMNSKLVVFETTVHTWNTTLYELYCTPNSILNWIRVQNANLLSEDGKTWTQHFGRENSFTYNNQYMAIDLKKFIPGSKPQKGFLWTAEQVPGYYVTGERTDELVSRGWIPGINTPFFEEVYNASGYPWKIVECNNSYWDYEECARHQIMKRDVSEKVKTYDDFKKFMRYNDWENDELSNGDAGQSILSRYDLRPEECLHFGNTKSCPQPFGGIDAKTTNYELAMKLMFDGCSSPQYETQPVWEFGTGRYANVPYEGLPKRWEFPWVTFGPEDN